MGTPSFSLGRAASASRLALRRAIHALPLAERTVWRWRRLVRPARLGSARRLAPLSDIFGLDRGTPVDRYAVERFLARHGRDIRGRALEVRSGDYLARFGQGVERRDILDIDPNNPEATIVADLARADAIPDDTFDCFVLTYTLQFIYDVPAALAHSRRILRPGGVLLAVVPCTSRIDTYAPVPDYWRFTPTACARLFGDVFGDSNVTIEPFGNVLTCVASLLGAAYQELPRRALRATDNRFVLGVAIRAVKGAPSSSWGTS